VVLRAQEVPVLDASGAPIGALRLRVHARRALRDVQDDPLGARATRLVPEAGSYEEAPEAGSYEEADATRAGAARARSLPRAAAHAARAALRADVEALAAGAPGRFATRLLGASAPRAPRAAPRARR